MRKKIWLARNYGGNYTLFKTKPFLLCNSYWCVEKQKNEVIASLCPHLVKQWFGLKKHLRRKTYIRGTFSVSFTPDPPKSSRAGKKGK